VTALSTSGFVGRSTELALADRHLDAAFEGRPSVLLLFGEPGIGKTREKFAPVLMPILAKNGVNAPPPKILPTHNLVTPPAR
jgi:hypothetical protein